MIPKFLGNQESRGSGTRTRDVRRGARGSLPNQYCGTKPGRSCRWRGGNTWSLSSKRSPSARRILRLVSMRQFMPFSTLWMVRSATLALRASWAWVISRFSRISRTRFIRVALPPFVSMTSHSLVTRIPTRIHALVSSRQRFDRTVNFFSNNACLAAQSESGLAWVQALAPSIDAGPERTCTRRRRSEGWVRRPAADAQRAGRGQRPLEALERGVRSRSPARR